MEQIPKNPIRFVASVSRPHWPFAVVAILFVTAAQAMSNSMSYILKLLVDATTKSADPAVQSAALLKWGVVYVGVLALSYALWRCSGFTGLEWETRAEATAYKRLFGYLSLHSHSYFSNRFAGALSNKVSNAGDGVDRFIESALWNYYSGLLSLIFSLALLATVHRSVAILFAILIVVVVVLNIFLVRFRRPYVVAYADASSTFRGVGVDVLTNITAVRQYARRSYEMRRFSDVLEERQRKAVKQWRISEWSLAANNVLIVGILAFIVLISVRQFIGGSASVGDVVLVISLVIQTSGTLVFIGNSMNGAVRLYGEMQDGLEEILQGHEIADVPGAKPLRPATGGITYTDVHFAYENRDLFHGLSLSIAPGERVGIVGGSGAGKTTLVSLLLRQHEIQSGVIAINEQNIAEVTQDSLREAISLVPQDPQLFHRSIKENIIYGKLDATDDEVVKAAEMAYADEFVKTLPEGYETLVGERGVKLSGGQRQRIAIARAILKNAPILVLDEATSALDSASEVLIQRALHALMEGKTVIAIAHRLSTLRAMNRIIVLDEGVVAESGTHEELIAHGGIYATLWGHQVDGFIQDFSVTAPEDIAEKAL